MREWLTVIICLLIAGILLDGLRRMRRARREGLRISRNVRKFDEGGLPEPGKDGSARVVSYRDNRDAETLTRSMRASFARSKVTVGAPSRTPEQPSLNLEESVPMLMDSVEDLQRQDQVSPRRGVRDFTQAPSWAEPKSNTADDELPEESTAAYSGDRFDDDPLETSSDDEDPRLGSIDLDDSDPVTNQRPEPGARHMVKSATVAPATDVRSAREKTAESLPTDSDNWIEPEEVLIINLMAPAGEPFDGAQLLAALLEQGMRFGSMNIFHRHKHADGSGPVHFSLANMVMPGTFDLATMSEFSTPGLSMFMGLPNDDSLAAFDCMAATAKALARTLGGELKDENRSVMTRQTIEHCRQRVIEFERKQRLTGDR